MGKSISFDIAALVLLIILINSCYVRKMTSGISNRIFLIITLTSFVATICDIAAVTLDNMQSDNIVALYTTHSLYLMTHYLSVPFHLLFVISLTDTWHKLRKQIGVVIILILPVIVMWTAFVTNAANQLVFSVENGYTRGSLFPLMYATTFFYIGYDIFYIIRYRSLFTKGKIMALSTVIPIGIAAMIVQMFNPHILIEMFCNAISLLIISIGIQRPEDYVDSFTQLMKYSAYVNDMKRTSYNDKHVKLIMINLGNFRSIQSMVGFDTSIQVLREVADILRKTDKKMKSYADLYYLDNGRFRVVLSGRYCNKATIIADELNEELKRNLDINGLDINLTPYIVLASYPEEITDFKTLMSFGADYHLKTPYTGKVMHTNEMYNQKQLNIQNNIDMIINRAIENGSFEVYYQPIYSLPHNKYISAEALIRLNDPEYGFISPETLITAAEQNGAIHKIGEIVFEKVCQFIARDEFKNLGLDYIEVNLSVAQIMNGDLPDQYMAIMNKYHVTPDKINLEITETAAAYAQQVMMDNLDKLTQAGISFSLDDYGTGYSNMKRVIQLPLKIIKLDKSFVSEQNNPKVWIFLRNTVKMLKDMNMEIVVEGVETQEMLDAFTNLQCDFIQGYYFSKPIPRNDFVTFITNSNKAS